MSHLEDKLFHGVAHMAFTGTFNADSRAVFCLGYDSGLVSSHWFSPPPPPSFPPPHHRFTSIRADPWSTAGEGTPPQHWPCSSLPPASYPRALDSPAKKELFRTGVLLQFPNHSQLTVWISKFSLFIRSTPNKISLIIVTFPVRYEKCLFANVKMGSHGLLV